MKKSKLIGLVALLLTFGMVGCNGGGGNDNPDDPGKKDPDQPAECVHEYGAWNKTADATCKAKGSQERTCSKCGNVEKQDIAINKDAHKLVADADSDKAATCAEPGVTGSKKCEICGTKVAGTAVAATGHTFVNDGEKDGVVQKIKCSKCDQVGYVLDVADATGWNNATTKMNGKNGTNDTSTWTITGKIPAGSYDVQLEGKMSSSSHSNRKWYNMAKADLCVDGKVEETATSSPDTESESDYRYFLQVGENVFNPSTKKSWGDLGYTGDSYNYGDFVSGLEIPENATSLVLKHGNIGYSMICSKLRLIYNAKPVEVQWSALNGLDASSVGIEKNADYIRFNGTASVRDSSGTGTGCIAVYKVNSPRAVAKAELWFDAQSHSQTTSMFGAQSNDDVKGYISDGKGGWVNPSDYRYQVRVNGKSVAFTADNNAESTSTRDWYKFTLADFSLNAGENTIEIESTGGYRAKIYNFKLVEVK